MSTSGLEALLALHLRALGLPEPAREFCFAKPRRFRADFAYVDARLLIEVEGGIWTDGRHSRGSGYQADCEKYNLAALLGYRVLRFTGAMIESGAAVETIRQALAGELPVGMRPVPASAATPTAGKAPRRAPRKQRTA